MRIVMLKDLYAAHLGLDPEMGLLYPRGAILDNCLPGVEKKLLFEGFAIPEEQWQQQQRQAKAKQSPQNKRGGGPRDNK